MPWLFSILGIHFWSCGIRNAIGFSSLLVAYAFKKTDKFSNLKKIKILAIILFLIIAILCHWSIFLLFPFVIFPEIISTFLKLTKNTLLIKTKIPKNIFFIISIVVIFSILYIFSEGNSKIFTTYTILFQKKLL